MNIESSPLLSESGYFGEYGGAYIPEVLYETIKQLEEAFRLAVADPLFWSEFLEVLCNYAGRPTPLTYLPNLSASMGHSHIWVKREDLNHTGSHKLNNVIGQGLIAKRMGKKRIIAETGAGQHGMATATMAARLGFECVIYMGAEDVQRQYPNVFWMEQLGARVVAVESGTKTLKDAINEALRDWATNYPTTHYALGTACGPHPFPTMVSYFQSIIGREARNQILEQTGKLPQRVYACVGGGSNAVGIFQGFLNDAVELVGVEAGGEGIATNNHASRLDSPHASVGVSHGYKSVFLQNSEGQMNDTYSIAAGLDYVGVSPIMANWRDTGRVRFISTTDDEVINALKLVVRHEGLIPALESAHAFAGAFREVSQLSAQSHIIINQSGRGDKDLFTVADALNDPQWIEFVKVRGGSYDH